MVTAEDGTWGLGFTQFSGPLVPLINDHLSAVLVGLDCMATEKAWDMMQRITSQYGTGGLASYAISAVDNALWDLKGKLLGRPVYELLGGPQKGPHFSATPATRTSRTAPRTASTGFLELGFRAVKLFLRHGPEDGLEGLRRNEDLVARTREQIGGRRGADGGRVDVPEPGVRRAARGGA